ncbi:hypothetical protein AWC11_16500 [Mycobacterium interjectum]|nr:hypothetical protein AWC11_16500 [Mycobacterium interjectum]
MNSETGVDNVSAPDDLNIVEFERRLFPEPIRTLGDVAAALLAGLDLIDEYGRARAAAMNAELRSLEAASMSATLDEIKRRAARGSR